MLTGILLGWLMVVMAGRAVDGVNGLELGDDFLRVRILSGPAPDGIPRFDTSARAVSVRREGVEFLTGDGLVDEFNIRWIVPPGYADGVDCAFLKIGVGILQRTGCAPYRFWNSYPVLQAARTAIVERTRDRAVFEQRLEDRRFGYLYRKEFQVDPETGRVAISYTLENRGSEEFSFDQYNHTWLLLDPPTAERPWLLRTSLEPSLLSITAASLAAGRVLFQQPPSQPALFLRVQQRPGPVARTSVTQGRKSITAITRFPASRLGLFVTPTCLAPEVFAAFRVPPGGRVSWQRIFVFGEAGLIPSPPWRDALGPVALW